MAFTKDHAYSLHGKVALVTGAGRGIGRGIALELGQRGASVVVNYNRSADAAASLVEEIEKCGSGARAFAVKANVSMASDVTVLFDAALEHFGHLDVVVSNAGTEIFRPETEVTEADYDAVFALNTRAQFFVAQNALRTLRPGGRIVLTSSVAASMSGVANHSLYAGSKAAVEGFTRSFSVDCGHKQITVNAIAPGGVKTDMYDENAWRYSPGATASSSMEEIDKGLASCCPLKRVAVPQDIARIVAFLAHADSEWINGQVLLLTGGSFT